MEIKVEKNNVRIDKYLASNTDMSRALITKMIKSDFILVNGKIVKPSVMVKQDDLITIKKGFKEEVNFDPEDIPLDIIFEDEYLIVINKQSGLVVHPGNGNMEHTLVNALIYHSDNLSDAAGESRLGIVHRLDKDTSGLMIVAKTNKAHNILSDMFRAHEVKREYVALIEGVFPKSLATIDAPIGRDEKMRKKLTVTAKNSKNAITNLSVIQRYSEYTLVKLSLETGRTHQIRVHMKYIGYPIFNDPLYNTSNSDLKSFGQFLHSSTLDFIHPITKEKMHFECALPKEFQTFIDFLK